MGSTPEKTKRFRFSGSLRACDSPGAMLAVVQCVARDVYWDDKFVVVESSLLFCLAKLSHFTKERYRGMGVRATGYVGLL